MDKDAANLSVTVGWLFIGLFLIYLATILFVSGKEWLPRARFVKRYTEKECLVDMYTILILIWIPLSMMATVRYLQATTIEPIFILTIIFVPVAGVGIIKGIFELAFGVSSHIWIKWKKRRRKGREPVIWFSSPFTRRGSIFYGSGISGVDFELRFAQNKTRLKRAGAVRVLISIGLLMAMVYFLL